MVIQLFIGTLMIGLTVAAHSFALDMIIRNARGIEIFAQGEMQKKAYWKPFVISAIVLAVFVVHVVEIWCWAILFFMLDALPDFESALYFSTTAFTTVGFGDLMPVSQWRLLGSIEAANGFMLFGWSTAFTFEVLSQLYRKEGQRIRPE